MFIPYKAELDLQKVPFLSILVCLLCIGIFLAQIESSNKTYDGVYDFCENSTELSFRLSLESILEANGATNCAQLFYSFVGKSDELIDEELEGYIQKTKKLSGYSAADSKVYIRSSMQNRLWSFKAMGLSDLTADLVYYPKSYNVYNMFTSSVAHGDWSHLLGNLLFFFAFAATVELMLGVGRYFLFLVTLAIGTSLAYSWTALGLAEAAPTLGLSGVVMGMIGVFAYLMPTVNIRCLLWLFVFIRRFSVPAWLLALWFVGWDIYGVLSSEASNVNFVAHLSGAFIGVLFGILFLRKTKLQFARDGAF